MAIVSFDLQPKARATCMRQDRRVDHGNYGSGDAVHYLGSLFTADVAVTRWTETFTTSRKGMRLALGPLRPKGVCERTGIRHHRDHKR